MIDQIALFDRTDGATNRISDLIEVGEVRASDEEIRVENVTIYTKFLYGDTASHVALYREQERVVMVPLMHAVTNLDAHESVTIQSISVQMEDVDIPKSEYTVTREDVDDDVRFDIDIDIDPGRVDEEADAIEQVWPYCDVRVDADPR